MRDRRRSEVLLAVGLLLALLVVIAKVEPRHTAPDPGDLLDGGDVEWLAMASSLERSRVDPHDLQAALRGLDQNLGQVFAVRPEEPPSPRIDRVMINGQSSTVLIGAQRQTELPAAHNRCTFLRETAVTLGRLGWRLRLEASRAVVTDYPIVSPHPVDLTLEGSSTLGYLRLRAPASGPYLLDYTAGERPSWSNDEQAVERTSSDATIVVPCD